MNRLRPLMKAPVNWGIWGRSWDLLPRSLIFSSRSDPLYISEIIEDCMAPSPIL